jgi:hypothetical protein
VGALGERRTRIEALDAEPHETSAPATAKRA